MPWDGLFGGGDPVQVPATSTQTLESLKECMEACMRNGQLRIDIDLPPGLRVYAVDGAPADALRILATEPSKERVAEADLNLARVLTEILKVMQSKLCVAFRTGKQAKVAREAFAAAGVGSKVFAFDGTRSAKRSAFGDSSDSVEDAARFIRAVKDSGTTFVIVVAPRARQLRAVAELDASLTDKTCIILANARLRSPSSKRDPTREKLAALFRPAFNLRLVGKPGREGIVFHTTREGRTTPWVLAERTVELSEESGQEEFVAKQLGTRFDVPTADDISKTFGI